MFRIPAFNVALRLIAENKKTRSRFLDLGNCGLRKAPAQLRELTWLESLTFASGWSEWDGTAWRWVKSQNSGDSNDELDEIGPLAGLSSLRQVCLANTKVSDVTPLAKLHALQTVDLSNTQVEDLAPLARLFGLQSLNLASTRISNLTPLAELSALQRLNLSNTMVSDLAALAALSTLQSLDLAHTQSVDISPLSRLSALEALYLSNTRVSDLAPLTSLTELKSLSLSHTNVTSLHPIAHLSALRSLHLSNTKVEDLSPLAELTAMQRLDIPYTRVCDITPLARLTSIQSLNLSHTKATDLSPLKQLISNGCPVRWSASPWEGDGIYIKDCPLVIPPPEIAKQGNDAILNYLLERETSGVNHLYEAKLLIVGEGGAGKTSLLRRLYQPDKPMPTEQESTKGIAIHRHDFDLKSGRRFRLNVWDFGGQEIYHATHQFFLTRRSLYVLLDDTRKDHKSVSDPGFKYWLELIDLFGDHSPVLIFQNEKSGRSKTIDLAGIKGRFDNVKDRFAGDLNDSRAADALRKAIEYHVENLPHIGEELPANWINVRTAIEARAETAAYISQQEYFELYGQHMPADRDKALHLSRYLHDLGVFLHFQDDPLLQRTVILQNTWATEAVFRVLDDEPVKARFGRFTLRDCERIWADSAYTDMHPELLALMQRFELCYELADSQPKTWLAPQLLPPAKPPQMTDWRQPEDMVLRYCYDFMPKGLINRLTVRMHRFVRKPELAWTGGVLFERESTTLLAEVLPTGSEIELRARGPERKALLSVIAADLDALNDSMQGLQDKVDKRIPCHCRQCATLSTPAFFAQRELLRRKEHDRLSIECPVSYDQVDVLALLDGVRVTPLPGWAKEAAPPSAPQTIRIFLASSSELREDRDAFDLYFRQQNDTLRKDGVYLEIVRWEKFLDAIAETRSQDEYNKAVRNCDVFVSLFFTKTGKFTEEEFDTAYGQFKATGRPRIYTFFKNADIKSGSLQEADVVSLFAFKKKLNDLGHYTTGYDNIQDLKLQFRDQLGRLLDDE